MPEQLRVPAEGTVPEVFLSTNPAEDHGNTVATVAPVRVDFSRPPTVGAPSAEDEERPPPQDATAVNLAAPTVPEAGTKVPTAGTSALPGEKSMLQVIHEQLGFDGMQRLAEAWIPDDRAEKPVIVSALKAVDTVLGPLNILPAMYSNMALKDMTRGLRESGLDQESIASIVALPDLANQLITGILYGGIAGQPATTALRDIASLASKAGNLAEKATVALRAVNREARVSQAGKVKLGAGEAFGQSGSSPPMRLERYTPADVGTPIDPANPAHRANLMPGAERKVLEGNPQALPRLYYYTEGARPESGIGRGQFRHTVEVPSAQIYDIAEDPKGIWRGTEGGQVEKERALKAAGFSGYRDGVGHPEIVGVFDPLDRVAVVDVPQVRRLGHDAFEAAAKSESAGTGFGATVNLQRGNLAGSGEYVVEMYPEVRQTIPGKATANQVSQYAARSEVSRLLQDPRHSLGVWYDTDADATVLGVSITLRDRDAAVRLGKRLNEKAVGYLDPKTGYEEIAVGGSGTAPPGLPPPARRHEIVDAIERVLKIERNPTAALPDTSRAMQDFTAGQYGKDYYYGVRDELVRALEDPADVEQMLRFLGGAGMGTEPRANVALALEAFKRWKLGDPIDESIFKAAVNAEGKALRIDPRVRPGLLDQLRHIYNGGLPYGPKINPYYRAISGDPYVVVVDRWHFRSFFNNDSGTPAQRARIEDFVFGMASKEGVTPVQAQAALWFGGRGGDDISLRSLVRERIAANTADDFSWGAIRDFGPYLSEEGKVSLGTALAVARATIGAAVGSAVGETPEDRVRNAFVGLGLGAAVSPALVRRIAKEIEPFTVKLPEGPTAGRAAAMRTAAGTPAAPPMVDPATGTRLSRPYEYGALDQTANRLVDAIVNKSPLEARAQLDEMAARLDLSALPLDPKLAATALHEQMAQAFAPAWDAARGTTTVKDVREVANSLGLDDIVHVMEGGTESAAALSSPEYWALMTAYHATLRRASKILDEEIEGLSHVGRLPAEKIEEAYRYVRVAGELWARKQAGLSEGARVMRMAQEDQDARKSGAFVEGLLGALARKELDDASLSLKLDIVRTVAATTPGAETAPFFETLATRLGRGFALTHTVVQDAWKSAQLTTVRGMSANVASSLALAFERPLSLGLAAGWGIAKRAVGAVPPEIAKVTPPGFVYVSEVPAYAFGFLTGLPDAILSAGRVMVGQPSRFATKVPESRHLAWEAWKSVQSPAAKVTLAPAMALAEGVGTALRGAARTLILAPDEFVRTASYSAIVYQRTMHDAITAAKAGDGVKFAEIRDSVLKGIKDPTPSIDRLARAQAEVFAYSSPHLGEFGGPLASLARLGQHPVFGWVAPFARTIMNSTLTAVEHLPGGHAISPRAQKIIELGGEAERQVYTAQSVIALSFLAAGAAVAQNGRFANWLETSYRDLTGQPPPAWAKTAVRIEGTGPLHPASRKAWSEHAKPDTMYLPGHPEGLTLERFGHLGRFLALGAEIADTASQSNSHDLIENFLGQIAIPLGKLAMDPTFAGPMRDFVDAANTGDPIKLRNFVQSYARSVVPTGVRQVETLIDPTLRAEWDRTLGWAENLWQMTKSQVPGYSKTLPPRLDQWGDPMLSPEGWTPFDVPKGLDWLTLLSPAVGVRKLRDRATIEIIANQMGIASPDPVLFGPAPNRFGIEDPRAGIPLTREQSNRYVELQGNELKLPIGGALGPVLGIALPEKIGRHDLLNAVTTSAAYATMTPGPNGTRADLFRMLTRQYREVSEYALIDEYPQIAQAYQQQYRQRLVAKYGAAALAGIPDPTAIADQMVGEIRALMEAIK